MRAAGYVRGVLLTGMVFAALSIAGVAAAEDTPTAQHLPLVTAVGPDLSPPILDALLPELGRSTTEDAAAGDAPSWELGPPSADLGPTLDLVLPKGSSPVEPILSLLTTFGFALPGQAEPTRPTPGADPVESDPAEPSVATGPAESAIGDGPADSGDAAERAVVNTGGVGSGGQSCPGELSPVDPVGDVPGGSVCPAAVGYGRADLDAVATIRVEPQKVPAEVEPRMVLAEVEPRMVPAEVETCMVPMQAETRKVPPQVQARKCPAQGGLSAAGVPPLWADRGDPIAAGRLLPGIRVEAVVTARSRADGRHRHDVSCDMSPDPHGRNMIRRGVVPPSHPGPGYLGGARAGPGPPPGSERVESTAAVEPAAVVSTVDTIGAAPPL